ncbi:uncharacterized protein LOC129609826 [Condylostylus longicornis]|uniref:uncharacterized protein LOC129609826 n=1 Tax=Condylostylus longicornis TaxID=2530218 RepID=UPI00244D9E68|nr:uncharacterized protein LOC129609826 [Condylostylus longicornis]
MSKRNIWSNEETRVMLELFKEQKIIEKIDGKKYRNSEIYGMVENCLKNKKIENKSAKQIEIRWKNLKYMYINIKKEKNKSGNSANDFLFFEEMDELMGMRPSITTLETGVDTSCDVVTPSTNDSSNTNINQEDSDELQPLPSPSGLQNNSKRKRKSTSDGLLEKINKMQKDINEDFLKKQKELIDYEYKLYSQQEKESHMQMKSLLKESSDNFLCAIKDIFNDNRSIDTINLDSNKENNKSDNHSVETINLITKKENIETSNYNTETINLSEYEENIKNSLSSYFQGRID